MSLLERWRPQGNIYGYLKAGNMEAKPDSPTFADGHYKMQLCEAVERSAKEDRWVKVGK